MKQYETESKAAVMRARRSVRTFDGERLREDDAQAILEFAQLVENPYDIPVMWKLLDAGAANLRVPVITGTDCYIAGKLRRCPHAEEAFGYSFEKVVLFCQSKGIGTTWIAGTMDRAGFERVMRLEGDEVMPCISPLGYPAKKMALRETMMRKGVKADTRLDFTQLFFDGGFDRPLTPENAGALRTVLELVQLAPSAVNKQPWRVVIADGKAHFFEQHSGNFVAANGWDLQKVDIGIALCHFELAAAEQGIRTTFSTENPGIPAGESLTYIATFTIE